MLNYSGIFNVFASAIFLPRSRSDAEKSDIKYKFVSASLRLRRKKIYFKLSPGVYHIPTLPVVRKHPKHHPEFPAESGILYRDKF